MPRLQGVPASPGVVIGRAHRLRCPILQVPHENIEPGQVEAEIARFVEACERAKEQTRALRREVESRLGSVPAKIFESQLVMLEDPDLIDGALRYIRDSFLTAQRAFDLRLLEFRSQWLEVTHAMVVDRLADLADLRARVLSNLIEPADSDFASKLPEEPVILVASELVPSRMAELDRDRVLGIATDAGTRTSHASILARSMRIPAVVGLVDVSTRVESGSEVILDGVRGRVVIDPSDAERDWFRNRDVQLREARKELKELAALEPVTLDGIRLELHANLELPSDAEMADAVGPDGVGLLRTEFLVVGMNVVPDEEEQYQAFKDITEVFAPRPVVVRTYDLGGDKFPMFLPLLREENPYLGWRGIRVYPTIPKLFHNQVRAILRAAARGTVRMLLPLVNSVDEVVAVREVVAKAKRELENEGTEHALCPIGVMLETPAAIAIAEFLGRHVDFFSLGTNDLAQYTLAVDRGNAQLSEYYDPFHPAMLRFIRDAVVAAGRAGLPINSCGESASDTLGALLLIGSGVRSLSCAPSAIPQIKKLIRSIDLEHVERVAGELLDAETGKQVRDRLRSAFGEIVDLSTPASLSRSR